MKSLGSNTFGLMKQNHKGKFMLEGKYHFVKLGMFVESSDEYESHEYSGHMETEDDAITASEKEEEPVGPVATVVEEHVQVVNDDDDDDEEGDFEKGLRENILEEDYEEDTGLGGEFSGFNNDDISFNFEHDEYNPTHEDLDSFFEFCA